MTDQSEPTMAKRGQPGFSLEFKKVAVARMELGEGPTALAQELGVHRTALYVWRKAQRAGRLAADGRKGARPADPAGMAVARMRAQARASADAEAALQTLEEIMTGETASEASRISAANALLNRAQYKPEDVEVVKPTPQRQIVWLVVDPKH